MRRVLPLSLFLAISFVSAFAQRTQECFELYLGSYYSVVDPQRVIVDEQGYYILAISDVNYPSVALLARYDLQHNLIWRKNLGESSYYGINIFKGSNNTVYVAFGITVYKYSAGGTLVYTVNTVNFHDATVLKEDASGNLIVAGAYYASSKYYMAVSSYDSNGNFRWVANLPNNSTLTMWVVDMNVLADGSAIVMGNTNSLQVNYGKVRADGTIAFNLKMDPLVKYIDGNSMAVAQDGLYFMVTQTKADDTYDLYMYKTDMNGVVIRSTKIPAAYNATSAGHIVIPDNINPVVSYYSYNYSNYLQNRGSVTKFTNSGTVTWTYNRSDESWFLSGIENDNAGNIYAHTSYSTIKLTAAGAFADQLNTSASYFVDRTVLRNGDIYALEYEVASCGLTTLKNCSPLTVNTNISNKSVCAGSTTDFQYAVTGNTLTYKWTKDGILLFDDEKLSGTKTNKITIKNINAGDIGDYVCEVVDNCSKTATSATAKLSLVTPLSITTQPASKFVCASTTTTLTAAGSGGTNIKYQWAKNGVNMNDGGTISGSKAATITLSNVALADAATYTCSIVNDCGITLTTSEAVIVVGPVALVTKQPTAQSADEGTEATFTVEASGTGLSYQWKRNNVNVSNGAKYAGATSAVLTVKGTTCIDAGSFSCTVSGTCGTPVNSSAVALTVTSVVTITQNPTTQKICAGETMMMMVGASGTNLTYSWLKGATVLNDGGRYSGTRTSVLSIATTNSADMGSYSCTVSGGCSSTKTSLAAALELISAPSISSQTTNANLCGGETAQLSVTLSSGSYTYQWLKNNVTLSNTNSVTGVTSSTLFIVNGTSTDAGSYTCKVTGCGSASTTSNPIAVTIADRSAITTQPVSRSFCEGDDVSLTVAATGSLPKYQWTKAGVPLEDGEHIAGSKTNTLVIKNPTIANHQGFYSCRVQGSCGATVTSSVVQLIGNPKPDLFLLDLDDCFQFTAGTEQELVGDNEGLSGTFKIYRENSDTPLAGFQAIAEPGIYEIVKTTAASCSDALTVTVDCVITGLEDDMAAFVLSPNPSKDKVNLHSDNVFFRYEVIDALGVRVLSGDIVYEDQQIDLSHVANGYYVFVLHSRGGEKKLEKLIVNR